MTGCLGRKSAILVIALAALLVSCSHSKKRMAPPELSSTETEQREKIDELRNLFKKGGYESALTGAREFLRDYPSSRFRPEARYVLAMSYLRQGLENKALRELDKLVKNYAENEFASEGAETLRSLEARRLQSMAAVQRERERAAAEMARKMKEMVEDMRATAAGDQVYVVVDLMHDLVMLKMGEATLYAFPAATGKGWSYLRTTGEKRRFATPVGKHKVISKSKDPKWVRPDWYWLERGEEVPEGMTEDERAIRGYLGKYKIDIGGSIYFHGHQGPVRPGKYTHGCIRLNSGDLERLYELVDVGTPVYIF